VPVSERGGRVRSAIRSRTVAGCVLVAVFVVATGCADEGIPAGVGAEPTTSGLRPVAIPAIEPASPDAAGAAAARYTTTADGVTLPDPEVTPGAVFDDVSAGDVCAAHYTQGVRQPRYNRKVDAFSGYGVSIRDREHYAVDHLIPISLGGSNAVENIWPQPVEAGSGADEKDALEAQLHSLVCADQVTLAEAQHAIASDWWSAYESYMDVEVTMVPLPTVGPSPSGDELAAENGAPCLVEGTIGYTDPKHVPLTCTRMSLGDLRWQKRY
jgi:hypothetical protein